MNRVGILLALAGLGLSARPARADILVPVTVGPNFTATLTNFADPSAVFITASGPNGAFKMGEFSFYSSLNQFFVFDATKVIPDSLSGYFTDPNYNVVTDVRLTNLSLTETFSGGQKTTASLYSDPFQLDSTTLSNSAAGSTYLYSDLVPVGSTLVSATLSGQFSDGLHAPTANQQMNVVTVPEAGTSVLLLIGLALAALPVLGARVRAGRRPR